MNLPRQPTNSDGLRMTFLGNNTEKEFGIAFHGVPAARVRGRKTNMKTLAVLIVLSLSGSCLAQKSYKHSSEYQVGVLDQSTRVYTGGDTTVSKTMTDAKLDAGGQSMHFLHTDRGNFRVEAPINKGLTILAAMAERPDLTVHNKWFLDGVPSGSQVLFAARCSNPSKKHPKDTVRCTFWFPDPDSTSHEYETLGDFTPFVGAVSNVQSTANALCGTGKLNSETEAKVCSAQPTGAKTEGTQPASPNIPYDKK